MIAAVYARKSTEQHGVSDEQKSVTRQVENARTFATARGWTVDDAHVYVDDGVSGAEFAARPGFLRLMNALKPTPPFQVLVMSEESRLGREQIEVAYALKQLVTSGVRVFLYLTETERTLDSPIEKAMLALQAMADEMERERGRQRTTDVMLRKARAGHVCGGRVFGYANVEITGPDGRRSHVERRIHDDEAAVVRRIFQMCADGSGLSRIVKVLNAEGVPAPRPQRGRPQAWATSSVRAVLLRPLYRGEIVWNQTRKRDTWGQERRSGRPADAWVRVQAPDLRIISDELWSAAQARFTERQRKWANGGRQDIESRFLLSGFARCAECGGGLAVHSRPHGRTRRHFYACSNHWKKGQRACGNSLIAPLEPLEAEVLATLEAEVLAIGAIEEAVQIALAEFSPARNDARLAALDAQLADVQRECAHLAEAIAKSGPLDALVARLAAQDARRREVEHELRREARAVADVRLEGLESRLRAKLADWRTLLRRNVADGREVLRTLLVDKLRFTPVREGRRRGYAFEGTVALDRVVQGAVELPEAVASPTGVAPFTAVGRVERRAA